MIVRVLYLFLKVPLVGLQCVIVAFPGHIRLLFESQIKYCYLSSCPRADLLVLVGDVFCIFVTFPCGSLGQVWYLIVSFPNLCRLSYFSSHNTVIDH